MYGETMTDRNSQTRRRWLSTCTGVAGTAVLAGCFGSDDDTGGGEGANGGSGDGPGEESLGEDWPMYGVDLQNTAHQPDATGPEGDELTARPVIDLGGYGTYQPAVVDGTVYVSNGSGTTFAIDTETEEILWQKDGTDAPVVHDGTVYVPSDGPQLYGYDAETGDQWAPNEVADANNVWGPVPLDGRVLVASPEESIWEIDADTGEYTSLIEIEPGLGTTDMPAYHDGMYYIARSSELYGINVEAPEIEWIFETDDEARLLDSNPAVSDGVVYVHSDDSQLIAIEANSGDEVWTVDTTHDIETSPAVANGLVYTDEGDEVIAVDADDGDVEWRTGTNIIGGEDIVVADGVCYVTSTFGITAYDAVSGDFEWEYEVSDESDMQFNAPPAISNGTVYLPSRDQTLYAIEDA